MTSKTMSLLLLLPQQLKQLSNFTAATYINVAIFTSPRQINDRDLTAVGDTVLMYGSPPQGSERYRYIDDSYVYSAHSIFTARVRTYDGRLCFHRCVSVQGRGGVPVSVKGKFFDTRFGLIHVQTGKKFFLSRAPLPLVKGKFFDTRFGLIHVSQQSTFLYSPHTRIRSSRPDAWSVQDVIQAGWSVGPPSPGKASAPLRMRLDTSSYAGACVVRPSEKAL